MKACLYGFVLQKKHAKANQNSSSLFLVVSTRWPVLIINGVKSLINQVADLSPKYIFGNKKATDGTKLDLNIGDSPGFGGLLKRAKSTTVSMAL